MLPAPISKLCQFMPKVWLFWVTVIVLPYVATLPAPCVSCPPCGSVDADAVRDDESMLAAASNVATRREDRWSRDAGFALRRDSSVDFAFMEGFVWLFIVDF